MMKNKNTKKNIQRIKGLPSVFPLQCYTPIRGDIKEEETPILIGMDSGVCNTAFVYIEPVTDTQTKAAIDFKLGDVYYFKDELTQFAYKKDRQLYLAKQYFDLFSHKLVLSLTFEVLPLTSIRDEAILKGVIDAQETTTLISTTAYLLHHYYSPVAVSAIKYCLTGNGRATKEEMCKAAYSLTGDKRLLENDHMADAFADCFYAFIQRVKEDCVYFNTPIPDKYKHMDWNFKTMPAPPWAVQ